MSINSNEKVFVVLLELAVRYSAHEMHFNMKRRNIQRLRRKYVGLHEEQPNQPTTFHLYYVIALHLPTPYYYFIILVPNHFAQRQTGCLYEYLMFYVIHVLLSNDRDINDLAFNFSCEEACVSLYHALNQYDVLNLAPLSGEVGEAKNTLSWNGAYIGDHVTPRMIVVPMSTNYMDTHGDKKDDRYRAKEVFFQNSLHHFTLTPSIHMRSVGVSRMLT
ncbi:hypothetical protein ACJX0J_007930 [Zea mays]